MQCTAAWARKERALPRERELGPLGASLFTCNPQTAARKLFRYPWPAHLLCHPCDLTKRSCSLIRHDCDCGYRFGIVLLRYRIIVLLRLLPSLSFHMLQVYGSANAGLIVFAQWDGCGAHNNSDPLFPFCKLGKACLQLIDSFQIDIPNAPSPQPIPG